MVYASGLQRSASDATYEEHAGYLSSLMNQFLGADHSHGMALETSNPSLAKSNTNAFCGIIFRTNQDFTSLFTAC
jgi:hypothetical protein